MIHGNRHTPVRRMQIVWTCLKAAPMAMLCTAATPAHAQNWDTPQARLRPIGSPSAVDAFRSTPTVVPTVQNAFEQASSTNVANTSLPTASSGSYVRQAAMMQASGGGFSMPPITPGATPSADNPPPQAGIGLPAPLTQSPGLGPIAPPPAQPPATSLPRPAAQAPPPTTSTVPPVATQPSTSAPPPTTAPPTSATQPGLAPVPRSAPPVSAPSTVPSTATPAPGVAAGDYAPVAQPQLSTSFATMSNCRNITPPSGYRSDRILTCGPPVSYVTTVGASVPPPTYLPPPAQIGPPVVTLPPTTVPADALPLPPVQTVIPGSPGFRPLISFGQERYPVQVGQGIFGQPTAYVPGQSIRNAIRYLTW